MAAEFEELRLSVTVDDQATSKLDALKRNLADMGGGSQAAGVERFKRQMSELDESIKRFVTQLGEGPRAFTEFARGAGVMGAAALSLGYGLTEGLKKMREYSAELAKWPQTDPRTPSGALLCRKSPLSRAGTSRQSRKRYNLPHFRVHPGNPG
jgi:hypothetical protein